MTFSASFAALRETDFTLWNPVNSVVQAFDLGVKVFQGLPHSVPPQAEEEAARPELPVIRTIPPSLARDLDAASRISTT